MMDEKLIREKVHRAVDAYGASMQENPYLAQRILSHAERKEAPRMKKLSTGAIIAIVLMLLSVTAVAVGLTVEEMWQKSFEKMNTTGQILNLSDESQAEITMEEAIAIARAAIIAKYGTPEEELDAMGVYPTYAARGWDGKTDDYPSEWEIYFSSRTNVHLQQDSDDYGPTGEYRVYINAETKEVTYCHWYTNDFWAQGQRVWDCGSYDEVYWWYQQPGFYDQPIERQLYFEQLLASQGYELIHHSAKYKSLLKGYYFDRLYCDPGLALDNEADEQAAAAWAAVEQKHGYSPELLQKYSFIATRSTLQTGTDDIFLTYNYGIDAYMEQSGFSSVWCDHMDSDARRVGAFLVSFDPGTTHVVGVTHLWYSETSLKTRITQGLLYEQTDWDSNDLVLFDEAFGRLVRAVQRMKAAGLYQLDMEPVVRDYIGTLGGNPELYPPAPEDMDVDQWFVEESPWDALIKAPSMTWSEIVEQYGLDPRFWPMELQAEYDGYMYSLPREGEMTREEAIARAIQAVVDIQGQSALDALGDYDIGCTLSRYQNDGEVTRWEIVITDDAEFCLNGYRVIIVQRDGQDWGTDEVKSIADSSNG